MSRLNSYRAENAAPNATSIINSYRSFGYDLKTALADILDNSITAGANNIWINFNWEGKESSISILDDGEGMFKEDLIIAMTPGSKNPDNERPPKDLGRFGLGLKTASFSQCKSLGVATKRNDIINNRTWDIDYINETGQWTLLDFFEGQEELRHLEKLESGTLVYWKKIDRIVGDSDRDNYEIKSLFYSLLLECRNHLSLVFHKFIEKEQIKIFINEEILDPINPFLYNLSVKPEMGPVEELGHGVLATYFILPHMSRISKEEYENSGGPQGWFNNQGFYLYREDRLLVPGSWLGLKKSNEYSKLARIEINFSNANDFNWALDIKKSIATPPQSIRKELKRIAEIAIKKSMKVYNYRGSNSIRILSDYKLEPIWIDQIGQNGEKSYRLNPKNILVDRALSQSSIDCKKFIRLIEKSVPVDLIIYNQNEDPRFHESLNESIKPDDEILRLARDIHQMNLSAGKNAQDSIELIMSTAPFNNHPIIAEILKS